MNRTVAFAAALALGPGLGLGLASCAAPKPPVVPDLGDFKVIAPDLKTHQFDALVADLNAKNTLQDIVTELNGSFILPYDIGVRFQECDEDNAWYEPETHVVSLCLEMFQASREAMADDFDTPADLEEAVHGAFLFTTFHEVGHALIDAYDIPLTGREEDAADQLAAWWLIDDGAGDEAAISGALSFWTDPSTTLDETDFADEHALSQQRFYNLSCWVYGSDPGRHADLLEEAWLTPERAEQCEGEYETLNNSWQTILNDHLKAEA